MDELDPKLLARFRADGIIDEFDSTEEEFTQTVQQALARLEKHRRLRHHLAIFVAFSIAMVLVGVGLLHLSNIALIGDTPSFANNLAQLIGLLVLFGWIIFRRVRKPI